MACREQYKTARKMCNVLWAHTARARAPRRVAGSEGQECIQWVWHCSPAWRVILHNYTHLTCSPPVSLRMTCTLETGKDECSTKSVAQSYTCNRDNSALSRHGESCMARSVQAARLHPLSPRTRALTNRRRIVAPPNQKQGQFQCFEFNRVQLFPIDLSIA